MDYQQIDNSQAWAWPGTDLYLQTDSSFDDISYMFEGTTPIKSCGDFAYDCDDCVTEIFSKTYQDGKEYSSQFKRRKVLDFNSSDSEGISSSFLKSKERIDANAVGLPEIDAFLQDDYFPVAIEDFGRSEAWLTECLNDTDLTFSSDDGNASVTSDVHISAIAPHSGPSTLQRPVRSTRNIVFKGRKSYMRAPSKVSSTVAYPFCFIKPSSVLGEVTLKDINQLIHSPLKPKEETIYPTSAFSGKPVVGKTKIPTRGKGSITIMRTQG